MPASAAAGGSGSRQCCGDRWNRTAAWIQRARRRAFRASPHRINLADDIDAERFEGDEIWNVGVETAGGAEPLPEIHVVVMVHHLIASHRLVMIAMREGERRVVGGGRGISARIEEDRQVLERSGTSAVKREVRLILGFVFVIGLPHAE